MSALRNLASSIPHSFRKQMLEENWISQAQPSRDNSFMKKLFILYYEYLAPSENFDRDLKTGVPVMSCPDCISRYYSTFRSLLPYFIDLEKEYNAIQKI